MRLFTLHIRSGFFPVVHRLMLLLAMALPAVARSQPYTQIHLDKKNGLPSDHVYMFQTDKYGYLWLATEKGVVRYNGYNTRIFTVADGLPKDDIWATYLDRKDRLWLFTIANTLGYIHKNKFYTAVSRDGLIYPGRLLENEAGLTIANTISFSTKYFKYKFPRNTDVSIYRERYTNKAGEEQSAPVPEMTYVSRDTVKLITLKGNHVVETKSCPTPNLVTQQFLGASVHPFHNFLFLYMRNADKVAVVDIANCKEDIFFRNTPGRQFSYLTSSVYSDRCEDKYLYLFLRNQIEQYDKNLDLVGIYPVSAVTNDQVDGSSVVYLYKSRLWNTCVATETHGAFINLAGGDEFRKIDSNRIFLGSTNDSTGYWADQSKNEIIRNGVNGGSTIGSFATAKKLFRYDDSTSVILGRRTYLLDNVTGSFSSISGIAFRSIAVVDGKIYGASSSDIRVLEPHLNEDGSPLLNERFNDVGYDPATGYIFAYNEYSVSLFRGSPQQLVSIPNTVLRSLGINAVQKILLDATYRNFFVLDYDRLLVYDVGRQGYRKLLANYNLVGARMSITKEGIIAVSGKFGVAFIRILGSGSFSEPVVYHNHRDANFSVVSDLQQLGKDMLLTTDRGTFAVSIPTQFAKTTYKLPYEFLLTRNGHIRTLKNGDTIHVSQLENLLQFDVVRPTANGTLKYRYHIEELTSGWMGLNQDEMGLPSLEPGRYYKLLMQMQDDVWVSDPVVLYLYRVPTWWQTTAGKRVAWISGIAGALVIIAFTVLITRRVIVRNTRKRNELLELKLKSVYAQINPHFIYNTLSSALLLINNNKMPEAYSHISRFSRLLRAYVKSSRNKYISVKDEAENLKNYLELQQTRFKNKFVYSISIDEELPAESVMIPALLLQPFVENAIYHGLLNKPDEGLLKISFRKNPDGSLSCMIDDDGIGRKAAGEMGNIDELKESYGNELIKDLVNIFRKYENMYIEVKYTDKEEPFTGTIVDINIKNAIS